MMEQLLAAAFSHECATVLQVAIYVVVWAWVGNALIAAATILRLPYNFGFETKTFGPSRTLVGPMLGLCEHGGGLA
jgi:hypothetical protein